jgi:colanic acid/amylovoran biosynthesis glycosyltransferase
LERNINDYDIAHCHYLPNGDLAAILKTIGAFKGKIVTTLHGEASYKDEKGGMVLKAFRSHGFETLFESGDLFLPMSENEKQSLIKLGCDPNKIIVHRMGVDTNKFAFNPFKPGHRSKTRILSVGRLVEKKGLKYAIRAIAKVAKKYPGIEYKIVGDGPLRKDLQILIDQLRINSIVELLGSRPQEEIVMLLKEADLFLGPSVNSRDGDREGIPVVIMEAMALGLPVISTYHAGIPELVQNGISGFLVPERDTDALAERLKYLIEHQELWAQMGSAGRDFIEKYHDNDKLNYQLVSIFQQLLDSK